MIVFISNNVAVKNCHYCFKSLVEGDKKITVEFPQKSLSGKWVHCWEAAAIFIFASLLKRGQIYSYM